MRPRSIYSFIIISLCLVYFSGCLKPQKTGGEEPQEKKAREEVDNRYDPFDLLEDKEIIPARFPVNGELTRSGNLIISEDVSGGNQTGSPLDNVINTIDTASSQAFKIQFLTSKVYSDVRRAKLVAEEIFDRLVYLDYEVPYYKLRVGSFADRDQAEDYLQQVRMAGYNDAWVVVTNVDVKSLSPLYHDLPLPIVDDSLTESSQNESNNNEKTVTDE